jgi:YD repeat-containing protein
MTLMIRLPEARRCFRPLPARRRLLLLAAVGLLAWPPFGIPAAAQEATYLYDAAGRLVRATYPSGASITYEYDATGNLLGTETAVPACTLACSATVPAIAGAGSTVTFAATATPVSCSGAVGFQWSFGDGGLGAGSDATHAYATTGAYAWQVTATIADQTCTQGGTVTIVPSGGPARRRLRPGASSGAAGATTLSRGAVARLDGTRGVAGPGGLGALGIGLVNPGPAAAEVGIEVRAGDGRLVAGGTVLLAPREHLLVPDVLSALGAAGEPPDGQLLMRLLSGGDDGGVYAVSDVTPVGGDAESAEPPAYR